MNSIGKLFNITLYGESHQKAIGVVIDGVSPGTSIDEERIKADLTKRRPGQVGTTPRVEKDEFEITSGVFNGVATGSPIHIMIPNTNTQSKDYKHLLKQPRPGHADFVAAKKYHGFQDHRGGGRFSGRLTAPIVAAGTIAKMMLPMEFNHQLTQVGSCKNPADFDAYLSEIKAEGDSVGGVVEVIVRNVPIGLGEPIFYKLDAAITHMLMSIPAVKLVSFGDALEMIESKGSEFNDAILNGLGHTKTNHSGGIVGGISNGNEITIKVFIKPTSSIQKPQETFAFDEEQPKTLEIGGRHDVCIARRAGIVVESAVAIVLADMYLLNKMYDK
ncbi:MAG: chorismate synthase [Acholeplasmataceae bacterium]